jgi:hypothetical protein
VGGDVEGTYNGMCDGDVVAMEEGDIREGEVIKWEIVGGEE